MRKLHDKVHNNEVEQLALTISRLLSDFDEKKMMTALTQSHQILKDKKRESTYAEGTDLVTWQYESIKAEVGNMEQLFKARAYNKDEDRVNFINSYTSVLNQRAGNSKGSE